MPPSADDAIRAITSAVAQALAAGLEIHLEAIPPEPAPVRAPGDPLAGLRLTRLERAVIDVLLASPSRLTTYPLLEAVEGRLGEPVAEGWLKMLLSRLTAPEVGILSNDRHARPPGYAITRDFRAELAMRSQPALRLAE